MPPNVQTVVQSPEWRCVLVFRASWRDVEWLNKGAPLYNPLHEAQAIACGASWPTPTCRCCSTAGTWPWPAHPVQALGDWRDRVGAVHLKDARRRRGGREGRPRRHAHRLAARDVLRPRRGRRRPRRLLRGARGLRRLGRRRAGPRAGGPQRILGRSHRRAARQPRVAARARRVVSVFERDTPNPEGGERTMPNIGAMELVIVAVIALLVLGPRRLPDAGRS